MNENEKFEIKAEAFYKVTGMMAPGKDEGPINSGHSYEERLQEWRFWHKTCGQTINAMLSAFETHLLLECDLDAGKKCSVCGSTSIARCHSDATFAVPECDYFECEDCGHQWGHE